MYVCMYVCMYASLVSFGDSGLYFFISVLCGIPDRLSNDFFLAHP